MRGRIVWLDDALLSQYNIAFQWIKKYRPKQVIIAVPTSYIGGVFPWTDPYCEIPCMNIEQLKEMVRWGCEVASHTSTHPCLKSISKNNLIRELEESKKFLLNNLKLDNVMWFVPPYDDYPYPEQVAIINKYYKQIRVFNPETDIYIHELGKDPLDGPRNKNLPIADYESSFYSRYGDYHFRALRNIIEARLIQLWREQKR